MAFRAALFDHAGMSECTKAAAAGGPFGCSDGSNTGTGRDEGPGRPAGGRPNRAADAWGRLRPDWWGAALWLAGLLLATLALPPSVHADPSMPEVLRDRAGTDGRPAPLPLSRQPFSDGDYADMMAAAYLLALPGAAMTAGLGILLPVGMHYHHGNPSGGLRAFAGIAGGVAVGGLVGGLVDRPEGAFGLTPGMVFGALIGFFGWGVVDVLCFSHIAQPGADGLAVDIDWRGQADFAVRVHARM